MEETSGRKRVVEGADPYGVGITFGSYGNAPHMIVGGEIQKETENFLCLF